MAPPGIERRKPWNQRPECPGCKQATGTPAICQGNRLPFPNTNHPIEAGELYCPGCGHRWVERNLMTVAQAWWAAGAWEGGHVG